MQKLVMVIFLSVFLSLPNIATAHAETPTPTPDTGTMIPGIPIEIVFTAYHVYEWCKADGCPKPEIMHMGINTSIIYNGLLGTEPKCYTFKVPKSIGYNVVLESGEGQMGQGPAELPKVCKGIFWVLNPPPLGNTAVNWCYPDCSRYDFWTLLIDGKVQPEGVFFSNILTCPAFEIPAGYAYKGYNDIAYAKSAEISGIGPATIPKACTLWIYPPHRYFLPITAKGGAVGW